MRVHKREFILLLLTLTVLGTFFLAMAAVQGQEPEKPPVTPSWKERRKQNEQTILLSYKERIEQSQREYPTALLMPLAANSHDAFGYTFKDSDEPGGPAYNFEDISETGTAIDLGDDEVSAAIPLGFSFNFYGTDYTDVYVSSNGFLTVLPGQDDGCCTGHQLPQRYDHNGMIAGWWEDLAPQYGGAIHYQTLGITPNRTFILQFTDIQHLGFAGGNPVTFQYKLFEDTNVIEVHYQAAPTDGRTHSAGIENETGTIGLQYYLGKGSLSTPLAVRYYRLDGVFLSPSPVIGVGTASSTVIYTETLHNRTGVADDFMLTLSGNAWPTVLSISNTGSISNRVSIDFVIQVDIPPGAMLGDSDVVTITATSMLSPTIYSNTATIQTFVPGDMAYVTLFDSDQVALVDTANHIIVGSVDVGAAGCEFPWRAAMSPAGDYVYVGCYNSDSVAIIETANNTVLTTVVGIPDADGIAFTRDGAHALVGSRWSSQIAVVDTTIHTITSYIPTPSYIRSVAAHPYLDVAYATCGNHTILVVDTTAFSIATAIPTSGEPWDVAVSPDGRWVFTGDVQDSGLDVIVAVSNTIYTTVTGLGGLTGLEVAPDGSKVYASNQWDGIHVIDGTTFSHTTTVGSLRDAWEIATTCDGGELYVGNRDSRIPVIDTKTFSVTDRILMPSDQAQGIAICPQNALVLNIAKTVTPEPVAAGGLLTFTITVENTGSVNVTGVAISDTIPISTTFVSADSDGELVDDQVRWTGLTATVETDLMVHFVLTVGDVPSGTLITNDDYGVTCAEGISAMGSPVITRVTVAGWQIYLPLVVRDYTAGE
jgi:uncharacterized repeat protein (TIGR01451 family)